MWCYSFIAVQEYFSFCGHDVICCYQFFENDCILLAMFCLLSVIFSRLSALLLIIAFRKGGGGGNQRKS